MVSVLRRRFDIDAAVEYPTASRVPAKGLTYHCPRTGVTTDSAIHPSVPLASRTRYHWFPLPTTVSFVPLDSTWRIRDLVSGFSRTLALPTLTSTCCGASGVALGGASGRGAGGAGWEGVAAGGAAAGGEVVWVEPGGVEDGGALSACPVEELLCAGGFVSEGQAGGAGRTIHRAKRSAGGRGGGTVTAEAMNEQAAVRG